MSDNTIHLWGTDGARAGSISIEPNGGKEMSIIQVNIAICGLKNFDFWWHKIYADVQDILLTQEEIKANQSEGEKL